MIKRSNQPEDVFSIKDLEDDMETHIGCSRDEWVQFLSSKASDDEWGIWISTNKDGKVDAYIVLKKNVSPPLLNSIVLIYVWSKNHNSLLRIKELIVDWGKALGVEKVTAKTNADDQLLKAFGFKVKAKYVEMKIE